MKACHHCASQQQARQIADLQTNPAEFLVCETGVRARSCEAGEPLCQLRTRL